MDRVLAILESKFDRQTARQDEVSVYVASAGFASDELAAKERMEVAAELWRAGIAAETAYDLNPRPRAQIEHASESQIPFVVWTGPKEVKSGIFRIKIVKKKEEWEIPRRELVHTLRRLMNDPLNFF
jgi:histidyl-tRNA synthetase